MRWSTPIRKNIIGHRMSVFREHFRGGRDFLQVQGAPPNEWVADFALAGQAALDGPDWASRMVMFRLYYLGLAPYKNARHFLGLSEHGWVNWSEEIRRRFGKELLSRGMCPPRKYFTNGA
jgi:hypothetical protein